MNRISKIDLKSLYIEEIEELLKQENAPKFRAKQVYKWLQSGITDFDEMTNIPKDMRNYLRSVGYLADTKIERKLVSSIDGTIKYLYKLNDGEYIESVVMKYEHGITVCVSTEVGCPMGCKFCASGLNGKVRDLTASEILSQITTANRDNNIRISNVVMMGIGEPLDNFDNTIRFLKLVSEKDGLNIGLRHISLSTSGLVNRINELSKYNLPITLSISLHSPFDETRSEIMPVNKKWNIASLMTACKDYQKVTGRRISFEYALIDGVNDNEEYAEEIYKITRGIMCHINLIPVNPVKENDYKKPNKDKIFRFQKLLTKRGLNATIRRTLGADINASCGQLRQKKEEKNIENIQ